MRCGCADLRKYFVRDSIHFPCMPQGGFQDYHQIVDCFWRQSAFSIHSSRAKFPFNIFSEFLHRQPVDTVRSKARNDVFLYQDGVPAKAGWFYRKALLSKPELKKFFYRQRTSRQLRLFLCALLPQLFLYLCISPAIDRTVLSGPIFFSSSNKASLPAPITPFINVLPFLAMRASFADHIFDGEFFWYHTQRVCSHHKIG